MSLANEAKNETAISRIKKFAIFFVLIWIAYGSYAYYIQNGKPAPEPEKKTYVVATGDLRNSMESAGQVMLKDEFNLDFANPWIVLRIEKKEWDEVRAGEIVASQNADYLTLAIDKAKIALKIAEANYQLKKRWWTPDDIELSQKQLESSQASYDSSLSQSDMDTKIAEENLKIAKENLENAKKQSEINELGSRNNLESANGDLAISKNNSISITDQETEKYTNAQTKLLMEGGQLFTTLEKNLFDLDGLLWVSDNNRNVNDGYETYLWAKKPSSKSEAENAYRDAKSEFDTIYAEWKIFRNGNDTTGLEAYATRLKNVGSLTNKALAQTVETLKNSIPASNFPQTTLDAQLANFENSLSGLKNETASFAALIQTTQEAKTNMDLKIGTAKDQVATLEQKTKTWEAALRKTILENEVSVGLANQKTEQAKTALANAKTKKTFTLAKEKSQLEISKSSLESKKWADPLELEPTYMAVVSAKKNLEEAEKKKEDSYLRSPIDGKIVKISGNVGESTGALKTPFVTIINDRTFFIESQVAEEDIVKVKIWQKAYIVFDAIEWLSAVGEVKYASEKADIDANGVVSYTTRILFASDDKRIREWMSATAEYVTKEAKNVLVVPVPSVKTVNKKPAVLLENGEYRTVVTGFTDAKMVEVVSGLAAWDKILY